MGNSVTQTVDGSQNNPVPKPHPKVTKTPPTPGGTTPPTPENPGTPPPENSGRQNGTKKGMSQNWQNALSSVGSLFGGISGSDLPESDKAVREGIRSTIGQFGP